MLGKRVIVVRNSVFKILFLLFFVLYVFLNKLTCHWCFLSILLGKVNVSRSRRLRCRTLITRRIVSLIIKNLVITVELGDIYLLFRR